MDIREYLKTHILVLDGGMGTLLQAAGLRPGEDPEEWSLTHPEEIVKIHRAYFDAGSNVVYADTFGANTLKFPRERLEAIVAAALGNVRAAMEQSAGTQPKWAALDIGPTGKLLKPYGDLDFEDAVGVFAETVRLGVKYGADLIVIETMNDSYETKAALLAAKENSSLPVFVTNAYGADGKLMTGASPAAMVALLEGMGADAIGVNCSLGPKALFPVVEEYLKYASVPVIFKPNAGLPKVVESRTVYDVGPAEFTADVAAMARRGVRAAGGCCGTTPEHLAALRAALPDAPAETAPEARTAVSSYTHAVFFGEAEAPVLIGEKINPTGKPRLKRALLEGDISPLLRLAVRQEEQGAAVLDVNVGLPGLDEPAVLERAVQEIQAVTALPLQLDSSDPAALERALRRYNGKALVNSVNGAKASMDAVFPLLKKYGGVAVALTLDENGIPPTAAGRVEIAKKILREAAKYGLGKRDLIFDALTVTVSADPLGALETLEALRRIRQELGCHTLLGVSNVSYGLPERAALNSAYFALALRDGLSAAIVDPGSAEMMRVYRAFRALTGRDTGFADYLAAASDAPAASAPPSEDASDGGLRQAVARGFKDQAAALTAALLKDTDPLEIINGELIPALDAVGAGFENKTVYLPQLLMSAEAAGAAFEVIKAAMPAGTGSGRGPVVLATVRGDVHDIGKNIVRLLLENYGFAVRDLGKDVPPEAVAAAVRETGAPLVGLSALMTTTVPAMEETIALLRREAPRCKIVVGGAVLTADYAEAIGADRYAKDAMETVRYAERVIGGAEA